MKSKKITYSSKFEAVKEIKPSKTFIPEWYKNIKGFNKNNIEFPADLGGRPRTTVKNCVPFLDGMVTGYSIELWTDIHFNIDDSGSAQYHWAYEPRPLNSRPRNEYNDQIPVPVGYSSVHYSWLNPYVIKLPKGYSAIVMHPSNRFDLPFYTLTGIIDEELTVGSLPFFIKDGFQGLIEKGTPIYQIIPFKRESWSAELDISTQELQKKHDTGLQSFFNDYYRNNVWNRKEFN